VCDAAFGEALPRAPRRGWRPSRLLHQQRLVAVQRVQAAQAFAQVLGQLAGSDLHGFMAPRMPRLRVVRLPQRHSDLTAASQTDQLLHDVGLHVAVHQRLFGLLGQHLPIR
jgi:hypothetical protein